MFVCQQWPISACLRWQLAPASPLWTKEGHFCCDHCGGSASCLPCSNGCNAGLTWSLVLGCTGAGLLVEEGVFRGAPAGALPVWLRMGQESWESLLLLARQQHLPVTEGRKIWCYCAEQAGWVCREVAQDWANSKGMESLGLPRVPGQLGWGRGGVASSTCSFSCEESSVQHLPLCYPSYC